MKQILSTCALILMATFTTFAQDIIITSDSQKIEAKIVEVSKTEIKYKELDNLDGPMFVLPMEDIVSIIYANGKVYVPKKPQADNVSEEKKQVDLNSIPENCDNLIKTDPSAALLCYLDGRPKRMVAIQGDYSILNDKKYTFYFDIDFPKTELVTYGHNEFNYTNIGNFAQYLIDQNINLDKEAIVKATCEKYNNRMLSKKSTFYPLSMYKSHKNIDKDKSFVLQLHIYKIDMGDTHLSKLANGRTTDGGAVIYGEIEIKQPESENTYCTIVVDRVKGIGALTEEQRLSNVISEILTNQSYYINEFIIYPKGNN